MLYVVRHGESTWNLSRRTQGQIAHPRLTELGVAQASAAADLIAADLAPTGRPVDVVLTSDLVRARQTAAILADRLGGRVEHDARLREQSYGLFDGALDRFTREALAKLADEDDAVPAGESVRQVRRRMHDALASLPGDQVTVVVSHGDALRHALGAFPGARDSTPGVDEPWPNGSVVAVGADGSLRPLAATARVW